MFDCVLPTRIARHGTAVTRNGNVAIKAAMWARDFGPVEEGCGCYCCRHFTKAYVRHLLHCGEILGERLLTLHNVHFFMRFMEEMREAIRADRFAEWKAEACAAFAGGDECLLELDLKQHRKERR
jgi:queuine tRNA-ribosyltransferase